MNAVLVFVGGNALSVALLFAAALAVERFVPRPSVRQGIGNRFPTISDRRLPG